MTPDGFPPLLQAGMRFSLWRPAEPPDRFAPDAFSQTIGTIVPLRAGDHVIGHARVLGADVPPDGRGVMVSCEITDLEP